MGLEENMAQFSARQRTGDAARERARREGREQVASFIKLMGQHRVGSLAVYAETAHKEYRQEGFWRPKSVPTGGSYYTHELIGHGWPIRGTSDGNDRVTHLLTVMDNADVLVTTEAQNKGYQDIWEVPYLLTGPNPQPFPEAFTADFRLRALASSAVQLTTEGIESLPILNVR